jgi:hypothetical protein
MDECLDIGSLVAFMSVLVLVHLSLGAVFVSWAFFQKIDGPKHPAQGWRDHFVWVSLGMCALAVACDASSLFGQELPSAYIPKLTVASPVFLWAAFVLALTGRGPGRSLLTIASGLLLVLSLPFFLP